MFDSLWFTATLVFCGTVFGTLSIALVWELLRDWVRNRQVARRLEPVLSGRVGGQEALELLKGPSPEEEAFTVLGIRAPALRRIPTLLTQSNVEWRSETFLFITAGLGGGTALSAYLFTRSTFLAMLAGMVGAAAPYFYLRHRRKRRFNHFEEQFPEAIDLLTRAIRAGHPLASGIRMVGEEGPHEVAEEFRRVFEEQRFGIPFEDTLLGMVDRVDTVDVRIFVIAVLIQREVGGNLAEILDNLAVTIRGRFYIRRQLRVYTAQGRMSGYVLAALPIVVGGILALIQPDYVALLFNNLLGLLMVVTAVILQILGFFWIRKIVNIDI
jgi:tight adherence protein B